MIRNTFIILISILFSFNVFSSEIKIVLQIDDEMISNYDLKKEVRYLEILNPNIKELQDVKKINLAKISLINETIKKKEIEKFIDIEKKAPLISEEEYLKIFYTKLGIKDDKELKNLLKFKTTYNFEELKNKIKIDLLWNDLIFSRFESQVNVNKEKIVNLVNSIKNDFEKEYLISEIVFNKKKGKTIEELSREIKLSIDEIGFANTANIYSESDTSKFGGKIGWIKEISLPNKLKNELMSLKIGDTTDLINLGNNFIFLNISDIKIAKKVVNTEKEIDFLINKEANYQLEKFSKIYFNKIKLNYKINEL
jgi:peptidyl-prolyl cis-trans isomerase SurA